MSGYRIRDLFVARGPFLRHLAPEVNPFDAERATVDCRLLGPLNFLFSLQTAGEGQQFGLLLERDVVDDDAEMAPAGFREGDAVAANIHVARVVEDDRFVARGVPPLAVGGCEDAQPLLEIPQG